MRDWIFNLGFATLATHELDAVARAEWRILPLLNQLSEALAYGVFILVHIPLFAALIWLCWATPYKPKLKSRAGFAWFLVIHGGLHLWYSDHPEYQFLSALSLGLIFGAAALGLAYLLAGLRPGLNSQS